MITFQQALEKRVRLKEKLKALELIKEFTAELKVVSAETIDEVLLDLDEYCVAQVLDELKGLEGAELKTTEAKNGKKKRQKSKKK